MPSDRQIAANRANARRSTGPRTTVGRLRASRNALRHGLARPLPSDPALAAHVTALIAVLVEPDATTGGTSSPHPAIAARFAEAQLELIRIRSARAAAIAAVCRTPFDAALVSRLRAFERYERLARARRARR